MPSSHTIGTSDGLPWSWNVHGGVITKSPGYMATRPPSTDVYAPLPSMTNRSAAAVEAVTRPDYDSEDIVTDLINRVEFCLEDARKKGGDTVVAP